MNNLMEFLTSKEIIVVYIVVGIACFLYFVIYLFDKTYYKRKRRQNTKELNKLVESVNLELGNNKKEELPKTEEVVYYKEPVMEVVEENNKNQEKVNVVEEVSNPEVTNKIVENKEQKLNTIENNAIEKDSIVSDQAVENLILDNMPAVQENKEELQYTDIEPNQIEAQAELQKLTETLEKAEAETKNIDLTAFEEEQEQNAIISLDELMTRGKAMYDNNEFTKYEDEGNEPISLQDLEARMTKANENTVEIAEEPVLEPIIIEPVQEKMVLDDFNNIIITNTEPVVEPPKSENNAYQEIKKFHSSPVISPVYGIEKKEDSISANELELENTANYEKLDEEIKKTNEFLMTLRELQKKLD